MLRPICSLITYKLGTSTRAVSRIGCTLRVAPTHRNLSTQQNPLFSSTLRRCYSTVQHQKVKVTTGIVGLPVVENSREVLMDLYEQIVRDLGLMPQEAGYRQVMEQVVKERLEIIQRETDVEKIENSINAGQIEELIEAAKTEIELIPKVLEWKPWEVDPSKEIPIKIAEDYQIN